MSKTAPEILQSTYSELSNYYNQITGSKRSPPRDEIRNPREQSNVIEGFSAVPPPPVNYTYITPPPVSYGWDWTDPYYRRREVPRTVYIEQPTADPKPSVESNQTMITVLLGVIAVSLVALLLNKKD